MCNNKSKKIKDRKQDAVSFIKQVLLLLCRCFVVGFRRSRKASRTDFSDAIKITGVRNFARTVHTIQNGHAAGNG